MNDKEKESGQQRYIAIRKNVKSFEEAYPNLNMAEVMGEVKYKKVSIFDIEEDDLPCSPYYQFPGKHVEIVLKEGEENKAIATEDRIQLELERLVGEKLSCTCSPEMPGFKIIIYRVDYDMKGFTNCGKAV